MARKTVLIFLVAVALSFPFYVRAQNAQNMVWSQGECDQLGTNAQKLCNVLWKVQQILYALGIGLGAIMIIIGGIMYATAQDKEENIIKARKTIINGLIGVLIVFAFAIILGFVRGFVGENLL